MFYRFVLLFAFHLTHHGVCTLCVLQQRRHHLSLPGVCVRREMKNAINTPLKHCSETWKKNVEEREKRKKLNPKANKRNGCEHLWIWFKRFPFERYLLVLFLGFLALRQLGWMKLPNIKLYIYWWKCPRIRFTYNFTFFHAFRSLPIEYSAGVLEKMRTMKPMNRKNP